MGQRISYLKNNFGKGLKDLIIENYVNYRNWYLEEEKLSLDEYDENFGEENLKLFFRENPILKNNLENLNITLVNQLTSEFVNPFCDLTHKENNILNHCGPSMYTRGYFKSSELVYKTKDNEFIELWNYLINGRSLIDNKEFIDYSKDFKIGYLTYIEQINLKQKIEQYFGNVQAIKKKYWTFFEKLKEKRAIEKSFNGFYSLSGHNPKSSGLEFVLDVLDEIEENKCELISYIE
jgi:hypothetical protein